MNRLLIGAADKSALLLSMMADHEDGFLLLDTTGDLAERAADYFNPHETCYLDPSNIACPFGLNVLEGVAEADWHKVAKDILAFFDTVFPEGPTTLSRARSNYLLLNALLLLMAQRHPNMLAIPQLLSDKDYRTKCLRQCSDPVVLNFWNEEFPDWKDEDVLPLKAKLGDLFSSSLVRNIIGQTFSTFSLEGSNIVIANLDRRKLGDSTAFLLGSLFLSRSEGHVYISDLAFFGTDHLAGKLAQDRFTVAVDNLAALPVKLRAAVLGIADKTVFRTTIEDAEKLMFYVGVDNPRILTDLMPQEARVSGGTIEPSAPETFARLEANRRHSRALFTRPRELVEGKISRYFRS